MADVAAAPPADVTTTTPVAPGGPLGAKVPLKMPVKVPMKMPMKAPMPAGKIPAPASGSVPLPARVPAPVLVKKEVKKEHPLVKQEELSSDSSDSDSDSDGSSDSDSSSGSGSSDASSSSSPSSSASSSAGDSDDDGLLLSKKKKKAPRARRVPVKRERQPRERKVRERKPKRERAPRTPDSSDVELELSGDDEDNKPLFLIAKEEGYLKEEEIAELAKDAEPEAAHVGPPARPYRLKTFPGNIESKIENLLSGIERNRASMAIKDDAKTVSLGTSKVNYIDPRIICAFSKRTKIPLEKLFNKSLIKKFPWAMNVDEDFQF